MRRLESKDEQRQRQRKYQLIVGIILIGVMLFSTIGYGYSTRLDNSGTTPEEITITETYNGHTFTNTNGFWFLNANNQSYIFRFLPQQVETYQAEIAATLEEYQDQPLYISSPQTISEAEIKVNMNSVASSIEDACVEGFTCIDSQGFDLRDTLPTISCSEDHAIVYVESDEERIYQQDNCIVIAGQQGSFLAMTDAALYRILGIIL